MRLSRPWVFVEAPGVESRNRLLIAAHSLHLCFQANSRQIGRRTQKLAHWPSAASSLDVKPYASVIAFYERMPKDHLNI